MSQADADLIRHLDQYFSPFFYAPLISLIWFLIVWVFKRFLIRRLKKWSEHTTTQWDDILVHAVSTPANFLIFASSLAILVTLLPLSDRADRFIAIVFQATIVLSGVVFLDTFLIGLMKRRATAIFGKTSQGLTQGLVRGLLIGIGALTFLNLIGISVTPILASLGIGSLAVALALQDTLSNFFAGIYVTIDKPVKIGDFIRLESGEEGHVVDVGWRSSRIQLLSNNTVIIPNAKLGGSVITNYHYPDPEVSVKVTVGVHYNSDLEMVEKTTLEVARQIQNTVPGAVRGFEPAVRYHTLADSSVNFDVSLRAREFPDTFLIKHQFLKALHRRYRESGIVIPYPVRTIDISPKAADSLRQITK